MADVTTLTVTTDFDNSIPEEVDNMITNIAPTDTPFISSIGQGGKVETKFFEWLEDTLSTPGSNALVEGQDVDAVVRVAPELLDNRVQQLGDTFKISGDLDKTKKYGRTSEIEYQSGLVTKDIVNDLEWAAINSTKVTGTDAVAARMDGAFQFVDSTNLKNFGGVPASTNQITEVLINDVMQAMWEKGAKPDCLLAPPAQKRKISAFTQDGRITINSQAEAKKLTMVVDVFQGDFGTLRVLASRYTEAYDDSGTDYDKVLIYEKGRANIAKFRAIERVELAMNGDARKFQCRMSKSLKVRSKKCFGSIELLTRVAAS